MEKLRTESQKQASTLQTMGDAVHSAELRLNKKQQEFKEKEALEAQKAAMQTEVEQLDTQTRVRHISLTLKNPLYSDESLLAHRNWRKRFGKATLLSGKLKMKRLKLDDSLVPTKLSPIESSVDSTRVPSNLILISARSRRLSFPSRFLPREPTLTLCNPQLCDSRR